ncbi:helix-turn-helix domain-containing protein [Clostridium gasigenes]|uniref:helix-turn-helix domain-containing protein n=1 Tax=Clostridium gasigenes TaxID=94869 RepID=UPI001628E27C|nr:helix-turn-helix domain-containing protein [Clostridium gasigenes]MBB6622179.1 helix-turn-helix domain-containing protein [Clostridium gasigenes]
MEEFKRNMEKKTCTTKELAFMLSISEAKASQLTRIKGFPVVKFGRNKRIVIALLDEFLKENIGEVII